MSETRTENRILDARVGRLLGAALYRPSVYLRLARGARELIPQELRVVLDALKDSDPEGQALHCADELEFSGAADTLAPFCNGGGTVAGFLDRLQDTGFGESAETVSALIAELAQEHRDNRIRSDLRALASVLAAGAGNPSADLAKLAAEAEEHARKIRGQIEPEARRPVAYLDLEALRAHGIPPLRWILPGWIAERDVVNFSGPAGLGKSTTLATAAVSMSLAIPWCGIEPPRPRAELGAGH